MKNLGFVLVAAATAVGGLVAVGCASRLQTIIIDDEAGVGSSGSSGKLPGTSGGTSGNTSGGTSGGTSGTSGGTSGSSGTSGGTSGSSGTSGGTSGSSGTSGGTSGSSGSSGTTCLDPTPVNAAALPWKPPAESLGACTQADLTGLVNYVDANPAATFAQIMSAGVSSATCRACAFGTDTGTTWAPLVADAAGDLSTLNVGGCIAIASGNVNCGKVYQQAFDCRSQACATCADDASESKCLTDAVAAGGPCNAAITAVSTVCTAATVTSAETACQGAKYVFEGPIKAQCISAL